MASVQQQNTAPILVIGLGLTGFSVVKHLSRTGYSVSVADTRELPPYITQLKDEFPEVEIITGKIPYERFSEFSNIVASPGVELDKSQMATTESVIGDIELFVNCTNTPIIAITGSNGKSTVTMLVTDMLKAAGLHIKTGGNIGTPVLDLLDESTPDYFVLELSSFQLETTSSMKACSATILNISEDHMDRYQVPNDYVDAKLRIFNGSKNCIVNRDDRYIRSLSGENSQAVSFGMNPPKSDDDFGVDEINSVRSLVMGRTVLARVDQIVLQGDQNVANLLAGMALVKTAGVELTATVVNAALNFGGLPHRCEVVTEVNGVRWINDSKGTNVGATVAAIKGIHKKIILIAGGKGKDADFSPLAKVIQDRVEHTILFGEDAKLIFEVLDQSVSCDCAGSLEEAVASASKLGQPGSVVLFSPACASFDMFDNFEHRGNIFKQLVLELVH